MSKLAIPENLADTIADWIADQIIEGRLSPGSELSISDLVREFGVSNTPIREALRTLKADGLVELPPRRSPRVVQLTKKDVLDIYPCRAYLNGLAARLAAENMDGGKLSVLQEIIEYMEDAVARDDIAAYFQQTVLFNKKVAEFSENDVLVALLDSLGRRTLRLRYLSITESGRIQSGLAFHAQIMNAFRQGDAPYAEELMKKQINAAMDVLLKQHFSDSE